ncbi:hypothetical protein [Fuerstiella marisgermanici]|uniref:Uncharacterized protein n=1 Tax=Fuerstiella marisgermanici TaxID=1891926 RepID=A0A1P8WFG3_9PLAN|nr:hypothetical protein [Fuerstiella marisgermanici]APZ92786.1 hypothetical protein Fuma_02398 [Fuerstiella marisgermanici]
MDRRNKTSVAAKFSLAGLSRRRKIAAVILLVLLGAAISDTGTPDTDATISQNEHGTSHTDMDEISALLDVFNEEQDGSTAERTPTEPDPVHNTTAVTHFDQADQSPGLLTIPPAATSAVTTTTSTAAESPFQNVSQSADYPVDSTSTEELSADDETALDLILPDPDVATTIEDDAFEPEAPPSQIIVRPAGSRPTTSKPSRTSIRFTGTIYPVQ